MNKGGIAQFIGKRSEAHEQLGDFKVVGTPHGYADVLLRRRVGYRCWYSSF
jgi:hypothetical protein